jgi:hypothetical protein
MVRAAEASYAVPDLRATCGIVAAFVHAVETQSGKRVAQRPTDALIADAESIERALGC